jgi:transcription elongation GreA/GreB family factor
VQVAPVQEVHSLAMLTTPVVHVGSRVRVQDPDGEDEYTIVGPEDSDVASGRISDLSPLAVALLGRCPGERVVVRTPGGLRSVTIVGIV